MIRTTMLAGSALLLAPLFVSATAAAQSQSELDARYDRALAAGYKAMFLCSAIANAERNGARRTPESVMAWELTGIQAPLNDIVGELPYEIVRRPTGQVAHVQVEWTDDMPDRVAVYRGAAAGCSVLPIGTSEDSSSPSLPVDFETREVDRITLGGHGSDGEDSRTAVGAAMDRAFDGTYGEDARTTAAIVRRLRGGHALVWSCYADGFNPDTPQRTWSVAKSMAATVIGAAVNRGEADVHATAGLDVGENDPRREITIDQALRMASGRYSDTPGNRTDPLYFGGATVDEVAVDWPLIREPGTVFRYANNDTLVAVQAIEETFEDHPPAELLSAIGMHHTVAETDWQGNYILSSQVWSTAGDLARLGQLYLDDGVLPDGTRILPEGWTRYVSTPSGPQPGGSRGWGYGAGWWLLNNSEGIPSDTILAAGNRGQYIVVIPSLDVVIVRRGEDPAGGSGFDIEAFTRDVLAALDN